MDRGRARAIAEAFIKDKIQPRISHELVVTNVTEFDHSWVIVFNTREFVEGQVQYALAGNGPIIVNKRTGAIRQGIASRPVEEQLDTE